MVALSPWPRSLSGRLAKLTARFCRRREGATAVEFALIAVPFFLVIMATVQTAIVYMAQQELETVTEQASRYILTEQATNFTQTQFAQDGLQSGLRALQLQRPDDQCAELRHRHQFLERQHDGADLDFRFQGQCLEHLDLLAGHQRQHRRGAGDVPMADLSEALQLQSLEFVERQSSSDGDRRVQERTAVKPARPISRAAFRKARKLLRDRRGLAATEFAMLVPMMLVVFVGVSEVGQAISISRKVTITVRTVTDLVTQYSALSTSDMTNFAQRGFAGDRALSVEQSHDHGLRSPDRLEKQCDRHLEQRVNGTAYTTGQKVTLPSGISQPNISVIWGQAQYAYTPVLGDKIIGTTNLSDQLYMNPRLCTAIAYGSSVSTSTLTTNCASTASSGSGTSGSSTSGSGTLVRALRFGHRFGHFVGHVRLGHVRLGHVRLGQQLRLQRLAGLSCAGGEELTKTDARPRRRRSSCIKIDARKPQP